MVHRPGSPSPCLTAALAATLAAALAAGCGGAHDAGQAPTITAAPAGLAVAEGAPASLTVAASGAATLHYRWTRDGVAVGGDAPTFSLAAARPADAGVYAVTVSNAAGEATSPPARLAVEAALDWKGLTAEEEAAFGLNPDLLDTDGDGFSDFVELKELGFDPASHPYRFNPAVADVPGVKIELTSPPDFVIKYDYSDGTSASASTERSTSSSQSGSTSVEAGLTLHQEASVATEVTAQAGVLEWGGATLTGTFMISSEESFAFSSEQAWENGLALATAEGHERSNEVSSSEAKMAITVLIRNTGHLAFTMRNLVLSGTSVDRLGSDILRPIGNLEYEGSSGFPESTVAPGDAITGLTFSNRLLYVDTAKQMLRDSSSFYVGVAAYEIVDPLTGIPSNAQMTEIGAKTATVLIDYDTTSGRDAEKFLVATNLATGQPGVSLRTILERSLRLPLDPGPLDGRAGLRRLRDLDTSAAEHRKWVITHVYREVGELRERTYDITSEGYDLSAITVRAGDLVSLMYLVDGDGDGLPHRLERAMGTSDQAVDSLPGDIYPDDLAWYLAGHPVQQTGAARRYQLVFDGNGHTGGLVPSDPVLHATGQFVPVPDNPGGLVKLNVGGLSYRFTGWNTAPDGSGQRYGGSAPFVMGSADAVLYASWAAYEVGDTGPAGGKIFFKKNFYSDGWRYLEAAPANQNGSNATRWVEAYGPFWNAPATELPGARGRALGDGPRNTADIEAAEPSYNTAADLCANLVLGRYGDWFLPSYEELLKMREVPGALSATTTYWSSSQVLDGASWAVLILHNVGDPPAMGFSVATADRQSFSDAAGRPIKVRAARRF